MISFYWVTWWGRRDVTKNEHQAQGKRKEEPLPAMPGEPECLSDHPEELFGRGWWVSQGVLSLFRPPSCEEPVTNIPPVSPCILVTGWWCGRAKLRGFFCLTPLPTPLCSDPAQGPSHWSRAAPAQHTLWQGGGSEQNPFCFLTEATFFNTSFIGNKDETLFFISYFFLTKLSRSYLGKEGGITEHPRIQDRNGLVWTALEPAYRWKNLNTETCFLSFLLLERNYLELHIWERSLQNTSFNGFPWKTWLSDQKYEENLPNAFPSDWFSMYSDIVKALKNSVKKLKEIFIMFLTRKPLYSLY